MRRKVKYIQPKCLKRYEKAIKTSDMCVGLSGCIRHRGWSHHADDRI